MKRALAIALLTATCAAPVLISQSQDCTKWLATYRAQLLRSQAARRLAVAKRRLQHPHPVASPLHRSHRHRMGPLESLRRFEVACGELTDIPTTGTLAGLLPPADLTPPDGAVTWPVWGPPVLAFPPPKTVDLTSDTPETPQEPLLPVFGPQPVAPVFPLPVGGPIGAPVTGPVQPVSGVPECGTWLLVLTGVCGLVWIRKQEVA